MLKHRNEYRFTNDDTDDIQRNLADWERKYKELTGGVILMRVELIEKYDMSIGTVRIINSDSILHIGDIIWVENNEYQIKKFLQPTGAYDETMISVLVQAPTH